MSIPAAKPPSHLTHALTERLKKLFASPGYRPPVLPGVALEIVELSQRPNVGFQEVVALLERDPLLAARVLSVAGSALYAPMGNVVSLKQAAVRLGLKTLRDLVLEAALNMRVFRAPGYEAPMERLRRHASVTAQLARVVCRHGNVEGDYAFVGGLLHDVGMAAAMIALVDEARGSASPVAFAELAPALHAVHAETSALVARLWKLPASIQEVVGAHHRLDAGGGAQPLVPVLVVAEQLAYELDCGMTPAEWPEGASQDAAPVAPAGALDANPPEVLSRARALLSLDDARMDTLRAEAVEVFMKLPESASVPKARAGRAVP